MNTIEIRSKKHNENPVVPMHEMEHLQIGRIIEGDHKNHIVMCIDNDDYSEVLDISDLGSGKYWCIGSSLRVELLHNAKLIIEIND